MLEGTAQRSGGVLIPGGICQCSTWGHDLAVGSVGLIVRLEHHKDLNLSEPEAGPKPASVCVWDKHTCMDRSCVCEVLLFSIDNSQFTLARSFLHKCRLLLPSDRAVGQTLCL